MTADAAVHRTVITEIHALRQRARACSTHGTVDQLLDALVLRRGSAGVREYWIVNPLTKTVNVYDLEKEELCDQYSFDDDIQVCIYDNLMINIAELLK